MIYFANIIRIHAEYRALGAGGYCIERPGELGDVVEAALESSKPTVIDMPLYPEELPPMEPRMKALQWSVGTPGPAGSISWKAIKALASMRKER
jgi:thiamine pyrophosphate-dependent acetolactate synthase large subunit-like protein